jgi:hypothetical protein
MADPPSPNYPSTVGSGHIPVSPERVFTAPQPPTLPPLDPLEPARRAIAYGLLGMLAGIILISAVMLSVMLYCEVTDGAHFVLDWIGITLGPVAALAGSAVTFYMERSRRS